MNKLDEAAASLRSMARAIVRNFETEDSAISYQGRVTFEGAPPEEVQRKAWEDAVREEWPKRKRWSERWKDRIWRGAKL